MTSCLRLTFLFPCSSPMYLSNRCEKLGWHKIYLQMFIALLLLINKNWKQPRCPSVEQRINKLWYVDIMKYYSAIKEIKYCHEMAWLNLKCILLSETSQSEKAVYFMITMAWHSKTRKTIVMVKNVRGCQWFKKRKDKIDEALVLFLWWWSYSVQKCNSEYMTVCIYQSP